MGNCFGHNRHGPKSGGRAAVPLPWEGAGYPSNTMSPGLRLTSVPSGILIHPTGSATIHQCYRQTGHRSPLYNVDNWNNRCHPSTTLAFPQLGYFSILTTDKTGSTISILMAAFHVNICWLVAPLALFPPVPEWNLWDKWHRYSYRPDILPAIHPTVSNHWRNSWGTDPNPWKSSPLALSFCDPLPDSWGKGRCSHYSETTTFYIRLTITTSADCWKPIHIKSLK